MDVDQDGKPGANDPSAWYSGNPIMGNADTSGVILELSVAEDIASESTRHCHTDIGESPNREWIEGHIEQWTIILVCDGGTGPQINGTVELSISSLGFAGAVNVGIAHAQRLGFSAVHCAER